MARRLTGTCAGQRPAAAETHLSVPGTRVYSSQVEPRSPDREGELHLPARPDATAARRHHWISHGCRSRVARRLSRLRLRPLRRTRPARGALPRAPIAGKGGRALGHEEEEAPRPSRPRPPPSMPTRSGGGRSPRPPPACGWAPARKGEPRAVCKGAAGLHHGDFGLTWQKHHPNVELSACGRFRQGARTVPGRRCRRQPPPGRRRPAVRAGCRFR